MSLLVDPLMEYWMVDDTSLSNSDSIVLVVYMVLRLETSRISCMSTPLFDTELIGMKVSNLAQLVIRSGNQLYEYY